ncbi:MAG: sugar ABC transporter permease, partial [Planctomycetes bacterium]|nr:sugar ABC transporter permease [Planctomycetota bacterium]
PKLPIGENGEVLAGAGTAPTTAFMVLMAIGVLLALVNIVKSLSGSDFPSTAFKGNGTIIMLTIFLMVIQFTAIGIGIVFFHLPAMAEAGLTPPEWLANYHWAKPAIMIMGLWGSIGSNNMLLYLAGISNIPQDLYEAADIDGASKFQSFWHVTWPQLAPITFFIMIMSVIGGLQGGFEMARTMTKGGPAGATTTLSYFIYTEGFETGRLGFASAVAWALFGLVFLCTMFNWKFGSRHVND